jgi:hypothetical protein
VQISIKLAPPEVARAALVVIGVGFGAYLHPDPADRAIHEAARVERHAA